MKLRTAVVGCGALASGTHLPNSQKSELLSPGNISIFGKKFDYTANEIDWHQDLFSGKQFPLTFAKTINIRSNPDLSAKNVWEVNRLQFLVLIALDYAHTGDKRHLDHTAGALFIIREEWTVAVNREKCLLTFYHYLIMSLYTDLRQDKE